MSNNVSTMDEVTSDSSGATGSAGHTVIGPVLRPHPPDVWFNINAGVSLRMLYVCTACLVVIQLAC
jgi:hypothetical protein